MNIISIVSNLSPVKVVINKFGFFKRVGKREFEVCDELLGGSVGVVGELVLLHAHVGAPDGRVLAGQHEQLHGGACHHEPHLVLQLGSDVHHRGAALGQDGQGHYVGVVEVETGGVGHIF